MGFFTETNLRRVKVALYGVLVFLGFFPVITVAVTTNKVGICYLYRDRKSLGASSNCHYVIGVAVLFQLVYSLLRVVLLALQLTGRVFLATDFFLYIFWVVDFVAWFLVFVSACIMSAGINFACSAFVPDGLSCNDHTLYFAQDHSATSRMMTGEVAVWISVALWLVLVLIQVIWFVRNGKFPCLRQASAQSSSATTAEQVDTPPKY